MPDTMRPAGTVAAYKAQARLLPESLIDALQAPR